MAKLTTLDIIKRLPLESAARAEADEYFQDVPVIVADEGDVGAEIARKQALVTKKNGKSGAALIVLQLMIDDDHPNLQFGPATLKPGFQVLENPELNRGPGGTGKTARQLGRRLRDLFKLSAFVGLTKQWSPDKQYMTPLTLENRNIKGFQCEFTCLEASADQPGQVAMPTYSLVNDQLTIACTTAGAVIFYTTDDSPYQPQAGRGTAYLAPITVTDGMIIRACAYVPSPAGTPSPGMIASSVARETIFI